MPPKSTAQQRSADVAASLSRDEASFFAGSPQPAQSLAQASATLASPAAAAAGPSSKPRGRKRRRSIEDSGNTSREPNVDDDADGASGGSDGETRRSALPVHPEAHVLRIKETIFQPRIRFSFDKHEKPSSIFRKNRIVQSCTTCRRRKTKCDRKFPCGPCKARKEEATCVEYVKQAWEKPTGYTHVNDTIILANRVSQLEQVLARLLEREGRREEFADILADPNATGQDDAPGELDDVDLQKDGMNDFGDGGFDDVDNLGNDQFAATSFRSQPHRSTSQTVRFGLQPLLEQEGLGRGSIDGSTSYPPELDPRMMRSNKESHETSYSKPPSVTEHEAALTLEDMALGRGTAIERPKGSANSQAENDQTTFLSSLTRATEAIPHSTAGSDTQPMPTSDGELPGFETLPRPLEANFIVDYYLRQLNRLFRVIHVPTFRSQCRALQTRDSSQSLTLDEIRFTGIYAAVLTTSIHAMEDSAMAELGWTSEDAVKKAEVWSMLTQMAWEKSDWMQKHHLANLQSFCILTPYMWASGRTEYAWTVLGTTSKIAVNIGLSRLGPEVSYLSPAEERTRFGLRWASRVKREIGRRVWWYLVEADWLIGLEHHFSTSFHEDQSKTAEPANIDDADLTDEMPIQSKPVDVYTDMSYILQKTRLVFPLYRLMKQINSSNRLRYSSIQDAHAELMAVINNMPPYYRRTSDPDQFIQYRSRLEGCQIERIMINTMANTHLLRIHRLYLSQAYINQRYALSRETCISSSKFIIEAGLDRQRRNGLDAKYWGWSYGTFTATVVLLREYANTPLDNEPVELLDQITMGLDVLRRYRGLGSFGKAAATLERVLEDQRSRRAQNRAQRALQQTTATSSAQHAGSRAMIAQMPTPNQPWSFDNHPTVDSNASGGSGDFDMNNWLGLGGWLGVAPGPGLGVGASGGPLLAGDLPLEASYDWTRELYAGDGGSADLQNLFK